MICTCGHSSSVHRTFDGDGRCSAVGCLCSCLTPSGFRFADPCPSCASKDAELSRLRSLATRWYLADGSFETLPEEEVIRRRKEAAKTLARVEDVESFIRKEKLYDHPGDAAIFGQRLRKYLLGEG